METLDKGIEKIGSEYVVTSRRPRNRTTFPGSWGIARVNRAARQWRQSLVVADGLTRGARRGDGLTTYHGRAPREYDRVERVFKCRDDAEALRHFHKWLEQLRLQSRHGVSGATVRELLGDLLQRRVQTGSLSETTATKRRRRAAFMLETFGDMHPAEITADMMQQWVNTKLAQRTTRKGEPLQRDVARQHVWTLVEVLHAARAQRLIDDVPTEPVLDFAGFGRRSHGKDTLSYPEAIAVLRELGKLDRRMAFLALVQFSLGLRWGEATALQLGAFYTREVNGQPIVFVRITQHFLDEGKKLAPGTKSGRKHDALRQTKGVPVPATLWADLQRYLAWLEQQGDKHSRPEHGGWLFAGRTGRGEHDRTPGISLRTYNQRVRAAFVAAGLPKMANASHAFRKAFSDHMREALQDEAMVTALMGQASVALNRAAYQTTTDGEHAREVARKEQGLQATAAVLDWLPQVSDNDTSGLVGMADAAE